MDQQLNRIIPMSISKQNKINNNSNQKTNNGSNQKKTEYQGWMDNILSWGQQTCKKHFDSVKSTIYNTTLGHFYASDIMRHILVEIPDYSRILDIGIGTGYVYSQNSDLVKRKNIHITGIDIDPAYIKSAKHTVIDADLESNVKLIIGDINEIDEHEIKYGSYDFVFFTDSYSSMDNVHSTITLSEKYLTEDGIIVVASTLFDYYDENIDWIKQRLFYVSSIQFGNMMLKGNLEEYIKTRYIGNIKQCFRVINTTSIPGTDYQIKTYIVKWQPNLMIDNTHNVIIDNTFDN